MDDKPTVYIETSVVSYLVARPSREAIVAARQRETRSWWNAQKEFFSLVTSQTVIDEASQGDPDEARKRLSELRPLPVLPANSESLALTHQILEKTSLPPHAIDDAAHIATAVVHGVEYLLTWNVKHIANAQVHAKVRTICQSLGYQPPLICTPEEIRGDQ